MLKEDQIRKELKQIEEYLLRDRGLGKLPTDFIMFINADEYGKSNVIRGMLLHILGEKIKYKE